MATITLDQLHDCAQRCGEKATVYGIDGGAGGWGGHYCEDCVAKLGFRVIDTYVLSDGICEDET